MCNKCLSNLIESSNDYANNIQNHIETLNACEGCKSYYNFLLGLNDDCKELCLAKVKK